MQNRNQAVNSFRRLSLRSASSLLVVTTDLSYASGTTQYFPPHLTVRGREGELDVGAHDDYHGGA